MRWLLLVLMMAYCLLLEVRIQADIHQGNGTQMRLILRVAAFQHTWHLLRAAGSKQVFAAGKHGMRALSHSGLSADRGRMLLALFRRADRARRFLLHHTHLDHLDAQLSLRTADAARTALITGALRGIAAQLPMRWHGKVRIRVLPEFLRTYTTMQLRCIIRLRLGTILLTAMMLLTAYFRRQHLTESEEA